MLTIHDNNIILGSIGGGGGVAPPANGWLTPPVMTETTVNGLTDACGLLCNVLEIGDRNYFSCTAAGAYTVSVYTAVGGTLISSQNITANVQCNWQIDWDACTHNIDADTRQAYVEIVPQSGQSLTLLRFNTNHPAETNANSAQNIVSVYCVLPALTDAVGMFQSCYSLQSLTVPSLPALTTASGMFGSCYSLQSLTLLGLPALTTPSTNMFGTAESSSLRSLRKLLTTNLGNAFPNATTFILKFTAMQEPEALAWVASLGASSHAITFDLRSNPFSTSLLVAPAILAKFPNAVVQLI
jgi:hypothetical protein